MTINRRVPAIFKHWTCENCASIHNMRNISNLSDECLEQAIEDFEVDERPERQELLHEEYEKLINERAARAHNQWEDECLAE